MRLIDADAIDYENIACSQLQLEWLNRIIEKQPSVASVPLEEYNELRENFVDYVCGGVTNPAPFCKNKFAGCVDRRGWCMQTRWCRGFAPGGKRKSDG